MVKRMGKEDLSTFKSLQAREKANLEYMNTYWDLNFKMIRDEFDFITQKRDIYIEKKI